MLGFITSSWFLLVTALVVEAMSGAPNITVQVSYFLLHFCAHRLQSRYTLYHQYASKYWQFAHKCDDHIFAVVICTKELINPRRACAARVTVVNPRRACTARVTVVGFVCVCVCYSTSHLSNVSSFQKRYHLPNGRRRSENMWGFL